MRRTPSAGRSASAQASYNEFSRKRRFGGRGGIRTHGTLAGTPVFKTGALNRSATLPSLEFSDLAGVCAGGKYQLAVRGRRVAPICAGVAALWAISPAAATISTAGLKRTRKPASSSTAARNRLRSMRGNCRTPRHEYACCTCHSQSWSELIKTFGISLFERGGHRARSGPRAKTLKCMSNENTGAKQTQKRCNCLNHRKILRGPCANSTPRDRAQSKGFRGGSEDPAGVMHWHNSFAGQGNRRAWAGPLLRSAKRAARAFSPKSALPPPKLNAELTPTGHCGIGRWGGGVTYRIDDDIDDTPEQKPGRGPLFHIVIGVMLVCFGSASALVARAYGMSLPTGLPTLPSFSSGPSVASSPAPVAAKPVALSDLQALQQQVTGSVQSTERLLAAQQAEIKRLSDQVVVLTGKLDLLQRPLSSAQAALPAPACRLPRRNRWRPPSQRSRPNRKSNRPARSRPAARRFRRRHRCPVNDSPWRGGRPPRRSMTRYINH